jgi:hypothetical protein
MSTRIRSSLRLSTIDHANLTAAAPMPLVVCALAAGLLAGFLAAGHGQEGVDAALAMTGAVAYPAISPMAQYFLNSWTVINQAEALLMRAGLDQEVLDVLFPLLARAFWCAGYILIIFGCTRRPLFSLLAGTLCILTFFVSSPLVRFISSPDYSIPGFYALWAHAGVVWVVGCLAARRDVMAAFSAVLLIAVHPFIGAYVVVLVSLAYAGANRLAGYDLRPLLRGAGWGAAGVAVSLIAYFAMRLPNGHSDQIAYDAYMRFWDYHRNQAMTQGDSVRLGTAAILEMGILGYFIYACPARFFSAAMAAAVVFVSVAGSTLIYFAVHLAPGTFPQFVIGAMPGRLIDVHAFTIFALALGFIGQAVDRIRDARVVGIPWYAGRVLGKLRSIARVLGGAGPFGDVESVDRRTLLLCSLIVAILVLSPPDKFRRIFVPLPPDSHTASVRPETHAFWDRVRQMPARGLVLAAPEAATASLFDGHLPVVLDVTSFDFAAYLPYTAGSVAQIVGVGYGIKFYDPPLDDLHQGALARDDGRTYWAGLTVAGLTRLAHELGGGAVIAANNCPVRLPALITGSRFTLYAIPVYSRGKQGR